VTIQWRQHQRASVLIVFYEPPDRFPGPTVDPVSETRAPHARATVPSGQNPL
jgi:hypothetical protein